MKRLLYFVPNRKLLVKIYFLESSYQKISIEVDLLRYVTTLCPSILI